MSRGEVTAPAFLRGCQNKPLGGRLQAVAVGGSGLQNGSHVLGVNKGPTAGGKILKFPYMFLV